MYDINIQGTVHMSYKLTLDNKETIYNINDKLLPLRSESINNSSYMNLSVTNLLDFCMVDGSSI